jgi:sec-independent protein translocase protein TatA
VPNLGGWELIILLGVLVLVFGAKKLPDMARSVGQSARVLKGEMKGLKQDETPAPPAVPAPGTASPAAPVPAVTDR